MEVKIQNKIKIKNKIKIHEKGQTVVYLKEQNPEKGKD